MYKIGGHDMDLHLFYDRADVRRCPACKELLSKWDEDLTVVPIGKYRKYDIGASYDGVTIFSRRAKAIYDQSGMTGLQFTQLAHPDLYAVRANAIVHYDAVRRGVRFEKKCDICGRYNWVIGANPVYLTPGSSVPLLGFARTDLEFASDDGKHPLLICGDEAAAIFRAAKLKGLELKEVEK